MGDGTDRSQPLHHRVSTVKGVSVVHPLEGGDTIGCRASISNHVQHPVDRQVPRRSLRVEWYVVRNMGPTSFPQFYYFYYIVLPLVVLLCLPLFILTLLTGRLIKAIKAHRRMQAEMQRQHSQPDSSMTFALVIVVIVFIICRAPLLIWSEISLLGRPSYLVRCYMSQIYPMLLAVNSAVNVVIYILINRRFRNVLLVNVCRLYI